MRTSSLQSSRVRCGAHCTANSTLRTTAVVVLLLVGLTPSTPHAFGFRLWPLIDYRSAPDGQRSLHLLGPLFSSEVDERGWSWALRPLVYRAHTAERERDELTILYPLSIVRWDHAQRTIQLFGLLTSEQQNERAGQPWDRRFTLFPLIFYRHSAEHGTSLSVLPFYADLPHVFGYERVQLAMFPLYLRLREPLVTRTWVPFPFVGWTGGTLGHGLRLWPLYGWEDVDESARTRYLLWPFYVHTEHLPQRPEREERLVLGPFYARADTPTQHSRSYLGPLLTHTVNTNADTDTWGFPWPFWVSQRRLASGERLALRLAPFYQDVHRGEVRSRFYLWPLYRVREHDTDSYHYRRRDLGLVVGRDIEQVRSDTHRSRRLQTLFPLFRRTRHDDDERLVAPAVFDALLPHNDTIARLYAPLWQFYRRDRSAGRPPRWSLLWNLLSAEDGRVRGPVSWNR